MNRFMWITKSVVVPAMLSLIFQVGSSLAGPPLLCHPIEIGDSESLPWGETPWSNDKIALQDDEFVAQTLDLLSAGTPILVRMETIRRATIHAAERPRAAAGILAALTSRIEKVDEFGVPEPLALFDFGYLIASYSQMNIVTQNNSSGPNGRTRALLAVPDGLNPYDLVRKASALANHPAEMEFALALMTLSPARSSHENHLQNGLAAASEGSLLADNLVRQFGERGRTLTELRVSYGVASDGERH